MHLSPRTLFAWIVFVSVALVATRIAGSHLHLCFDGSEPPISFHSLDLNDHHGEEEFEHNDQDVSLPNATIAKIVPTFLDAFIVAALAIIFIVPLLTPSFLPRNRTASFFPRLLLLFLRPPLRGPPSSLQI